MTHETDRVLLEGGPMHGVKNLPVDLHGFSLTLADQTGHYHEVGRNEAGFRIFEWKVT